MCTLKFKSWYLLFLLPLVNGCSNDRSKKKHVSTRRICDSSRLFVETYTIFGSGAYGGDRVSNYLTDSVNFRFYIGAFDNAHENYTYQCKGDTIYIEKISIEEEGIPYKTKTITKIIEKREINLRTLQNQHKFE